MNKLYVIVWKYGDGSGWGLLRAYWDQARAQQDLDLLNEAESARMFEMREVESHSQMTCPHCGSSNYHEVKDEVDIGVGVQEHLIGYDCGDCGYQESTTEDPPYYMSFIPKEEGPL